MGEERLLLQLDLQIQRGRAVLVESRSRSGEQSQLQRDDQSENASPAVILAAAPRTKRVAPPGCTLAAKPVTSTTFRSSRSDGLNPCFCGKCRNASAGRSRSFRRGNTHDQSIASWSTTGPVAPAPASGKSKLANAPGTTALATPSHRDLQLLNRLRGGRYLQAIKRLLIAGVDRLPHSRREQPGPAKKRTSATAPRTAASRW